MPKQIESNQIIDSPTAVTCVVWECTLRNYTSRSRYLGRRLSIRAAKIVENRGLEAFYSEPQGIGGGFGEWISFHALLSSIHYAFKAFSIARALVATYKHLREYISQYRSMKIDQAKGRYMVSLFTYSSGAIDENDTETVNRKLLQLNLMAETIARELHRDYGDYRFSYNVNSTIMARNFRIDATCDIDDSRRFTDKLNHKILNLKSTRDVFIRIRKGRFDRVLVTQEGFRPTYWNVIKLHERC